DLEKKRNNEMLRLQMLVLTKQRLENALRKLNAYEVKVTRISEKLKIRISVLKNIKKDMLIWETKRLRGEQYIENIKKKIDDLGRDVNRFNPEDVDIDRLKKDYNQVRNNYKLIIKDIRVYFENAKEIVGGLKEIIKLQISGEIKEEVEEEVFEVQKIENILYTTNCDDCKLDIYRKDDGNTDKPVIIFVHGGAWKIGNKSYYMEKADYFAENDFVFVSVGYELHPDDGYHQQAGKVASVVKWVYDNAGDYDGDEDNIILMGHSSGGHLVSLLSTRQTYLQSVNLKLDNIKSTVLLDSAGLDIIEIKESYPFKFNIIYKPIFGDEVYGLRIASPINYITEEKAIPDFLIIHSNDDTSTKPTAIHFDEKLRAENKNSEIHGVDATHSEINENIGTIGDETTEIIMNYLGNL
ncbi:MAG: alpha/beta hydrolase fold domain-containing protein, partial [Candidatus Pacebacteria bacterium]|nr:alpha/beta hydrolase fold domain-containing protein [Candidatus Paceibacterota bacterium]